MISLIQLPALPTNAPTSGPPALVYWGLFAFFLILIAARYWFPSGTQRLNAKEAGEQSALQIQAERIVKLESQVELLTLYQQRAALNEEADREYRHALSNQNQGLHSHSEAVHTLLLDVVSSTPNVSDHLKRRVAELKTPSEIMAAFPLPRPKVWTLQEVKELNQLGRVEAS